MNTTIRKRAERARRKERGEVEYKGWLSASDHAALTQMAREARDDAGPGGEPVDWYGGGCEGVGACRLGLSQDR